MMLRSQKDDEMEKEIYSLKHELDRSSGEARTAEKKAE